MELEDRLVVIDGVALLTVIASQLLVEMVLLPSL
jgi:hypothetical protein